MPKLSIQYRAGGSQPFAATNAPGTCLWCGRKLPVTVSSAYTGQPGYSGNGHFCTARCGLAFGIGLADLGHRLERGDSQPSTEAQS